MENLLQNYYQYEKVSLQGIIINLAIGVIKHSSLEGFIEI